MQRVSIFVLLAMVAVASANFLCCPGERNNEKKVVKKVPRAASMEPNSDFSTYTPTGSKAIFAKPSSSNAMPTVHSTGDTMNLAARNDIAPVEIKPSPQIPAPMSPPRGSVVERNYRSPSDNILTPISNPMPIETRSRSPVPIIPMRSHISNSQVSEENLNPVQKITTPQAPPMPPKMSPYQKPSTGLNNNALSAGKANLKPVMQMPKSQNYAKSGINDEHTNVAKTPMPPTPPKLPNFSKSSASPIKNDGPMTSKPVSKAPPVAPPMPSKILSHQKLSIGFSNAALTAGRGGLKPVQTPHSSSKPTQLYEKSEATEIKRPPNPIRPSDLMASKKTLRPVSQMTKTPVVMPQMNQRSYKPMHQTSQATNDERSGVTNLPRRFDNPVKTPDSSNPLMAEFAMIRQRRNRINNVDWNDFDKTARKL